MGTLRGGSEEVGGFEEVVEVGGMEVCVVVEEVRCVVCGCPASWGWNDAVGVGALGCEIVDVGMDGESLCR
jgi:hypothetical protein